MNKGWQLMCYNTSEEKLNGETYGGCRTDHCWRWPSCCTNIHYGSMKKRSTPVPEPLAQAFLVLNQTY